MRFSKISVVLLLAVVALSKSDSGEADETQIEEEFNCNSVDSVRQRYANCFDSANVSGYSILNLIISGYITRDSFLAEVTSICSDEKIEETYTKCTKDLLSVCPDLSAVITYIVAEKVSFLCENNQPSSWIRSVLNEDYLLTSACYFSENNEVFETVRNCSVQTVNMMSEKEKDITRSETVAEDLLFYRTFISDWSRCTFAPYFGDDDTLPCGSKKKDMLLTYWIFFSTSGGPLRPTIGPEAMNQLRLMM